MQPISRPHYGESLPKRQKHDDHINKKLNRIENSKIDFNQLYELTEEIGSHICSLNLRSYN